MSAFTVEIFFLGRGIERFDEAEVLADPALMARLDLAKGMSGGLTFANDESRLLIDDDFDPFTAQILVELPQALRQGQGKTIELRDGGGRFDVALAGDQVTFDFGEGTVMTEPLPEVLAALDAAAGRLAGIRAAVA